MERSSTGSQKLLSHLEKPAQTHLLQKTFFVYIPSSWFSLSPFLGDRGTAYQYFHIFLVLNVSNLFLKSLSVGVMS